MQSFTFAVHRGSTGSVISVVDFDHYDLEEDPPLLVSAATIGHTLKCATLIGYQAAYYVTKEFPRLTPLLFFYASMCFRVIYVIYPEDS